MSLEITGIRDLSLQEWDCISGGVGDLTIHNTTLTDAEAQQQTVSIVPCDFKDIGGRLNSEISRILGTPDMKENLAKQGAEVYTMTPEQLGNWLKTEIDKWAKVVRFANIKPE